MLPSRKPTSTHLLNLTLLTLLAGLLLFLGLGSMGLTDRDEGRNAEAGREMFETGDWVSPTFNYEPRFAKPALVYWLMSISYSLFGVDEFSARLPSAIFGLGSIVLQYLFVSRFCGAVVGLFAALMLLLNLEMIGLSRMALTDSVLIFLTTLSLFSFWLGFHGHDRERRWRWMVYVGMALATLTKGPVGCLVPLVTISLYLTVTSQWRRFWRQGAPLAGTILFAALALPWYVMMWSLHGTEYAASAEANTVGRFFNPMEGHGFTILFYVPVLLLGFFPWSGWLPCAWYQAYRTWRKAKTQTSTKDSKSRVMQDEMSPDLEWFAALWLLGILLFFTLSSTRLPHYIGPLFPAAALLTAAYWHRSLLHPETKGIRASIYTLMAIGYLLAIGLASLPSLYHSFAGTLVKEFPLATSIDLGSGPYVASTVLLIGMTLVGYLGLQESRRAGAFWAAGASLALLVLIIIQLMMPGLNRYFISPPQELAYVAGLNLSHEDQLIMFGPSRPSLVFYAKRKVLFVRGNEQELLRTRLSQGGRMMIIVPDSLTSSLPIEAQSFQPVLTRFGYQLLSNQTTVTIPEGVTPPGDGLSGH